MKQGRKGQTDVRKVWNQNRVSRNISKAIYHLDAATNLNLQIQNADEDICDYHVHEWGIG